METLKLLIVDDEKIILRGLVETFPWAEMGYEIVGTAMNGEEALEKIRVVEPDVVLTDICMKRMDGIQLMEETGKSNPTIKFVVLSAYKDFDYAKEACRLGAVAYLLKPVTDEVIEVMKKVHDISLQEKEQRINYFNWKKFLLEDEENFFCHMLERYLKGAVGKAEFVNVCAAIKNRGYDEHYVVAVSIDVDAVYKISAQQEYDSQRFALYSYLKEKLREFPAFWELVNEDGSRTYMISLGDKEGNAKLKLLLGGIHAYTGFEITSAITDAYLGIDGMYQAFWQVKKLYEQASEEGVAMLEESGSIPQNAAPAYPLEIENQIVAAVRRGEEDQVKAGCVNFIGVLGEDENTNKIFLHQLVVRVQLMLNDSYGLSENVVKGFEDFYRMLFQYPAAKLVHIMYELLLLIVKERMQAVPKGEEEKYVTYIRRACEYMNEHMEEETLSVVQVSEEVFLNPVYFGRVFKTVKNMSFKQYLLMIRMEKAKQLLLNTAMHVTEICVAVGIPNPSYFAKLFKQYTGVLPSDYKK